MTERKAVKLSLRLRMLAIGGSLVSAAAAGKGKKFNHKVPTNCVDPRGRETNPSHLLDVTPTKAGAHINTGLWNMGPGFRLAFAGVTTERWLAGRAPLAPTPDRPKLTAVEAPFLR